MISYMFANSVGFLHPKHGCTQEPFQQAAKKAVADRQRDRGYATYLNIFAACLNSFCEGLDGHLDCLHAAELLVMLLQVFSHLQQSIMHSFHIH